MAKLKVGDVVDVKITGIQPYGAFVKVDLGITGLIHISEISPGFVKNIQSYFEVGQTIKAKVLDYDQKSGHAILSIKALMYDSRRKSNRTLKVRKPIKETPLGFSSLKKQLPIWVKETMEGKYD